MNYKYNCCYYNFLFSHTQSASLLTLHSLLANLESQSIMIIVLDQKHQWNFQQVLFNSGIICIVGQLGLDAWPIYWREAEW